MALKQKLELYVNQVQEPEDPALQKQALEGLKQEIRAAITSPNGDVNKPLKFLQPHYRTLKAYYQENMQDDSSLKELLADVLSVLATNPSETGFDEPRECLKYRLLGSKDDDFTSWGDEYVKKLGEQIIEEYAKKIEISPDDNFWKVMEQIFIFYRNRHILAETFVNAFLNAGFGNDSLMMGTDEWVLKNTSHEKISATASLGLVCLWDVDNGFAKLDKYFDCNDSYVRTGALLGVGILNSSIKQDSNHVLALLIDHVDNGDPSIRIGAIMGLGITYSNTRNKQIGEKLKFLLNHEKSVDVVMFSAIALALVYIGSCDVSVETEILKAILTVPLKLKEELHHLLWFLHLGRGLLYLRKPNSLEFDKIDNHSVHSCVYAGTRDKTARKALFDNCDQEVAVLGYAMVYMGHEKRLHVAIEDLTSLLDNEDQNIRKTVPLALSLLCISNPKRSNVIDILSRLSGDSNLEVAMSAIMSLGLVGSGTNNAQIVVTLRDLANHYCNDDNLLFYVRIAQGLVHLGKGLLTLNPYHSEGFLVSPVAIGGLVTFLYSCLKMNEMILGMYHYVLYFLVLAMQPKMLITVDENLKPLPPMTLF